jgi:demethylmenaquinone methyltransferase/2-methoxy-6-polyprenyl-1,4-benzoquinol methylase
MRWLEASPDRYDAGMRLITLGRVDRLHAALAETALKCGRSILEIGCGTGAVTGRLVSGGAQVTAIEQNPEMLERARARLADAPKDAVVWLERTASEIEEATEADFDAVVASLCLSEMSASERAFVLGCARNVLRDGGALVVGDEVWPERRWERWLFALLRVPQALLGWLLAGSLSQPIGELTDELRRAGFEVVREQRWLGGSLILVVARPQSGWSPP